MGGFNIATSIKRQMNGGWNAGVEAEEEGEEAANNEDFSIACRPSWDDMDRWGGGGQGRSSVTFNEHLGKKYGVGQG